MNIHNLKEVEKFVAKQVSTTAIVQDWFAQQFSRRLGLLQANLEFLPENSEPFFKKDYSEENFFGDEVIHPAEYFNLEKEGEKRIPEKTKQERAAVNEKIIALLAFRETTNETEGVQEISTYKGKRKATVLVRKSSTGSGVKEIDGLKILETILENFPDTASLSEIEEGKRNLLNILSECFPHSVGETLRRLQEVSPVIERELEKTFQRFAHKMSSEEVRKAMMEFLPTFKGVPQLVAERYAARLVFENIKKEFEIVSEGYREHVAQGEFRFFEPTITRGEVDIIKHHYFEARA